MKNFFARIKQFLKNFFGYQNTEEIKALQIIVNNVATNQANALSDLSKAINRNSIETLNALNSIFQVFSQRPIVPIVMNDKGYLLNLAVEKKVKMEVTSDDKVAEFKLIVDHTHTFFNISINMEKICIENMDNKDFAQQLPVLQHARVLMGKSDIKRGLLDRIALIAMNKLAVRSQHQIVDQNEAFYLFADTIIQVVTPLYEEKQKKDSQPVNVSKGPKLLSDEEKNGVTLHGPVFEEKNGVNIQEELAENLEKGFNDSQNVTEEIRSGEEQELPKSNIN